MHDHAGFLPRLIGQPAFPATDPNAAPGDLTGTRLINSICVVDLDRDGREDLLITLDRSGLSGISSDALVWLRSTN